MLTRLVATRQVTRAFTAAPFRTFATTTPMFKAANDSGSAGADFPDLTPLKYEQNLYATIKIHNRPFLVTEGDEIVLSFRLKHAEIGDELNFTDVKVLGSKNYTYHVADGVDPSVATIKGVVLEKSKNPMYTKEITKRRNRHTRHVQVKHDYTKVRITELSLNL